MTSASGNLTGLTGSENGSGGTGLTGSVIGLGQADVSKPLGSDLARVLHASSCSMRVAAREGAFGHLQRRATHRSDRLVV